MNLFKQAMYAKKIKSREDRPKDTTNRDIMCSIGITGVKAGSLAHGQAGQRWSKHKYLYIDANGRYVYPEDVAKAKRIYDAHQRGVTAVREQNKQTAKAALASEGEKNRAEAAEQNRKQKRKEDNIKKASNGMNEANKMASMGPGMYAISKATDKVIEKQQAKKNLVNASQMTKREKQRRGLYKDPTNNLHPIDDSKSASNKTVNSYTSQKKYNDKALKVGKSIEYDKSVDELRRKADRRDAGQDSMYWKTVKLKADTKKRKERKKINQQANSAHAGYYEDKKKFPDGGSTEELEIQKEKTAERKRKKHLEAMEANRKKKRRKKYLDTVSSNSQRRSS